MTWYEPSELRDEALTDQTQPEFPPAAEEKTATWQGEAVYDFVTAYTAFKNQFDADYNPAP